MDVSEATSGSCCASCGSDGTVSKSHESTTLLLKDALDTLQAHKNQLAVLTSRVNTLHEEHEAMRHCLHAASLVSRDRILAQIHRRRFSDARRDHPSSWQETMETVVHSKELALMVVLRAGLSTAGALHACSKTTRHGVGATIPELLVQFPLTIYAVGGEAVGLATDSVECLDVVSDEWRELPSLGVPRSGCAAVAMGGYLYVAGGCSLDSEDLRSVERLDLRKLSWEEQPRMQAGRDELAAVPLSGKIYAIGGSHLVWPVRHVVDTAECYTPNRDTAWEFIPFLSRERCAAGAVVLNGHIYAIGGCDEDGTALQSMERLGIGDPAWELMPPMRQPRCNFAAAATLDRILIAGGYDDRMRDLENVDSFAPATRRWSSIATLRIPRWGVRAIGRAGRVFVVGGHAHDGEVRDVDRLDLGPSQWISLSPLRGSRRSFGLAASSG